jgi:hypothetical protein
VSFEKQYPKYNWSIELTVLLLPCYLGPNKVTTKLAYKANPVTYPTVRLNHQAYSRKKVCFSSAF